MSNEVIAQELTDLRKVLQVSRVLIVIDVNIYTSYDIMTLFIKDADITSVYCTELLFNCFYCLLYKFLNIADLLIICQHYYFWVGKTMTK